MHVIRSDKQLPNIRIDPSFKETIHANEIEEQLRHSHALLRHAHQQLALTRNYPRRERRKTIPES
jgi:hypothetical protein